MLLVCARRGLFDAFGLVVQYDQLRSEVQVSIKLTDRLARAVARPRTRTAAPRRTPSSFFRPSANPFPPAPGALRGEGWGGGS